MFYMGIFKEIQEARGQVAAVATIANTEKYFNDCMVCN